MAKTIQEFLEIAVKEDASDLHVTTYIPPRIRVHGVLKNIDHPPLTPSETKQVIYSVLTDRQKRQFEEKLELDFSFGIKDLGRFRANVFMQKGSCRRCGASLSSASPSGSPSSAICPGAWCW
jgi:twitching motility protein PilT